MSLALGMLSRAATAAATATGAIPTAITTCVVLCARARLGYGGSGWSTAASRATSVRADADDGQDDGENR
jgi:hypothetical protein